MDGFERGVLTRISVEVEYPDGSTETTDRTGRSAHAGLGGGVPRTDADGRGPRPWRHAQAGTSSCVGRSHAAEATGVHAIAEGAGAG